MFDAARRLSPYGNDILGKVEKVRSPGCSRSSPQGINASSRGLFKCRSMVEKMDSVAMEVVRHALGCLADEMGRVMVRTARSRTIKELKDCATSLFNSEGVWISGSHFVPLMMSGLAVAMKEMLKVIKPGEFEEDDVIIMNDPFGGGQHPGDVLAYSPVFYRKELVGFVGSIAHLGFANVGGGLTSVYQEGLRIPFMKLYEKGKPDEKLLKLIETNSEVPVQVLGDLGAMVSCGLWGVKRFQELLGLHGKEKFLEAVELLMDYSENRVRVGLEKIPEGIYKGGVILDDDGITNDSIQISVTIEKKVDQMKVDFTGTDKQVKGNINCPFGCTYAGVWYTVLCLSDPYAPVNDGCFRMIDIIAPKGSLLYPVIPAGTMARTNVAQRIPEAIIDALGTAIPDKVMAECHSQAGLVNFHGIDPRSGQPFSGGGSTAYGGCGGRPMMDGVDGGDYHLARFHNSPIEAHEMEAPLMIECYEFVRDTGGAGKFRGGCSVRIVTKLLADARMVRYGEKHKFPPRGLFGGKDGTVARYVLNPGTPEERKLPSKGQGPFVKSGDVVLVEVPGGGGYGNPLERDPERVRWDVLNGKVSLGAALREYGVKLDPDSLKCDYKATENLRVKLSNG